MRVVSGAWNDEAYPQHLEDEAVKQGYDFICVTEESLPGWWNKLEIIARLPGKNLWIDADCIITGSLKPFERLSGLCIPNNWAKSGHGGCQSSVVHWDAVDHSILDRFDRRYAVWPPSNRQYFDNGQVAWGDQEWITYLRDTGQLKVTPTPDHLVKSFKYHVRPQRSVPHACSIVAFHGKPKPSEVNLEHYEGFLETA